MRQLKLVGTSNAMSDGEVSGSDDRVAQLLSELERAWDGADRELGDRAARCIRELIQQKEQATVLMLESSQLLKTALQKLHALRALI